MTMRDAVRLGVGVGVCVQILHTRRLSACWLLVTYGYQAQLCHSAVLYISECCHQFR